MKLTQLFETDAFSHTEPSTIRAILANIPSFIEDEEWVLTADGIVTSNDDIGRFALVIPSHWEELKVKFGSFPTAEYLLLDSKLTSLVNSPTEVARLFLRGSNRITNLRGCPQKINDRIDLVNCAMTSLTGAPKQVNTICIDGLNKLIDLRGLKDTNANFLTVNNCAGITSLDGMPTHVRDIISLNGLNDDFVVKFPHGTSMGQGGQLRIGGSLAHRLSPTLVTGPGII